MHRGIEQPRDCSVRTYDEKRLDCQSEVETTSVTTKASCEVHFTAAVYSAPTNQRRTAEDLRKEMTPTAVLFRKS